MLTAALHAYNKLLTTHPIRINSMTGTLLGAVGDFFSQRIDDPQRTDVDWQTCASAAVFGAGMSGFFIPWWYRNLDIWIPGTAFAALAYKSGVDIILMAASPTRPRLVLAARRPWKSHARCHW